jgi:tetratricopeptide (TPR) repeat protein
MRMAYHDEHHAGATRAAVRTILLASFVFVMGCAPAFSQKLVIEVDTLEGQLLQQIDSERDAAKKLTLLEDFARKFPNHEAVTWVLSHVQTHYLAANQYDRVFESGVKILGVDPTELSAAHHCLKAAEAKKDLSLIKLWSAQVSQLARRNMQSKRPEYGDDDDIAAWKSKVEYARQVEQYSEYALYFASLQSKDSKTKSNLIETLEQRNPMSEYLAQMRTANTTVVRQVDIEEAVVAAEAQFQKEEYNEDLLLMVATHYMQKRRETEKIINYSLKIIEILGSKAKPEEISDAEWDNKKRGMLGTSYWMSGLLYSTQNRFALADRQLRMALPFLKNSDMLAGAYYHLGYVNYRMAEAGERIRIHDAVRFTKDCININSAVQQQAIDNLKSMKVEYGLQD